MTTRARKLRAGLLETYGGMIKEMEVKLKAGEDVPDCLAKTIIQNQKEEELEFLDMALICAAFMIGGVETVSC
jgi:hypothetical protein